jgi:hypothetical protein
MIQTQMVEVLVKFLMATHVEWNTFELQGIKNLFSKIICMRVLRKSSLRDYWILNLVIHASYTVSVRMSRDRFLALLAIF